LKCLLTLESWNKSFIGIFAVILRNISGGMASKVFSVFIFYGALLDCFVILGIVEDYA
jgi:hypothetical protein